MTAAFKFGAHSLQQLQGVAFNLVRVVNRALYISAVDFTVFEGRRTIERQKELYAQGRTAPGPIVTWTMNSRHLPGPDGLGCAVDLVPINPIGKQMDWNFKPGFMEVSRAMYEAAKELGVKIRWGEDWNGNGIIGEPGENDLPHFEIMKE